MSQKHTPDFRKPYYLLKGNDRQKLAFEVLRTLRILDVLADYDPVLTGTIPIDVDLPGSDLDIICEWPEDDQFEPIIRDHYGLQPDFQLRHYTILGLDTIVANFRFTSTGTGPEGFPIEIFGHNLPVEHQMAYRHMRKEYEILQARDESFRADVRALKDTGHSTEAAFALLLDIPGDPYVNLLTYELPSD